MSASAMRRRQFLKTTAAAASALAIPTYVASSAIGKAAPSNRLRMASIGTGRMGHGDMMACLKQGMEPKTLADIVAVCDLDRTRAEHAKKACQEAYAKQSDAPARAEIEVFDDYRELLKREDIDGVTISVPDHWHAIAAIAAANAGKAIYLQKPLTHTLAEGKKLVAAVRANQVVLQTGSQQRSDTRFRLACELVRNGRIGNLQSIEVRLPPDSGFGNDVKMPVPESFNYEMWLGPTKMERYTQDRVHPQEGYGRPGWLQIEAYCRGMITGWGAHMFDTAQWGHGSDDSGPVEMQATAEFPNRGLFNVHTDFQAEGRYADGVRLLARSDKNAGVKFIGDEGSIDVTRSSIAADPPKILSRPLTERDDRLYHSDNHMGNFLECARSGQDPICPVEVGHRSNSVCIVTHIAMKLGRKLSWDPSKEQFANDEEANSMLDYPHRKPYVV